MAKPDETRLQLLAPDQDSDDDELSSKLKHPPIVSARHAPSSSFLFKAYVISSMTVIWSAYTLTVRYTQATVPADELYSSTAVVLLSEFTKLFIVIVFLLYENDFDVMRFKATLQREFTEKPTELLKMAVPSIAYTVQNNLDFVALHNLDAGVYQVTTQLKVVSTAIFMMLFLGRRFSPTRWLAIFLLCVGVASVQFDHSDSPKPDREENHILGLIAVLSTCVTAGFAGVYFEMMLKDGTTPFWIRNLQLYTWGAICTTLTCMISSPQTFTPSTLFHGFNGTVYFIVGCLSFGGIYISLVMKHLDNLHKSFASAVSIILIVVISLVLFNNVHIGAYFVVGSSLVCVAILLYNSDSD
uniref:UDP-galactose transporter n=1 Tax=Panagrellus redivivus TaxID=6233 RepID=A0A7E4VBX4_PANRE